MERLIMTNTSVYEIDEECLRQRKQQQAQKEKEEREKKKGKK